MCSHTKTRKLYSRIVIKDGAKNIPTIDVTGDLLKDSFNTYKQKQKHEEYRSMFKPKKINTNDRNAVISTAMTREQSDFSFNISANSI